MRNTHAKITNKDREELIDVIRTAAADRRLFEALLDDLLTPAELTELTVRLQIVKRLLDGDNQRDIAKELGVSLATVGRGSRVLQEGKGAFRKILKKGK